MTYTKKQEGMPIQRKKNKLTETVPEKDLTDLLGNDFKTINLQILKQENM